MLRHGICAAVALIALLSIAICTMPSQAEPPPTEIDAEVVLADYTPPADYTEPLRVGVKFEPATVINVTYEDLFYHETTPENVQEFLDHIPPCPWFDDSAVNVCSLNARYISLEAKDHGLEIGECTIIDTDRSRIQKTGISGHRVNVFEYENKKYFTTNLNRLHSEVVTASELYEICNKSMGLNRIGTKDYRWFADAEKRKSAERSERSS